MIGAEKRSKKSKKSAKLSETPADFEEPVLDKDQLFQMPNKDLLKYIPYCTDIYLGNDWNELSIKVLYADLIVFLFHTI